MMTSNVNEPAATGRWKSISSEALQKYDSLTLKSLYSRDHMKECKGGNGKFERLQHL